MQYPTHTIISYMDSENGKTACTSPVIQARVRAGMTVAELVEELGKAGAYNAGYLARATDICTEMFTDTKTTRFLGLAGAMVPGGMGGIVEDLIRDGYVDVLVSTGANLTHDIIEAIGCHHYHGTEICDDDELYEEEINRIYDIFLPSDAFVTFEEFMQETLGELTDGSTLSISGLLRHIGEHLDTGILAATAKADIPVYCPAIQDSMIGLQYWLFGQTRKVTIDAFADMNGLMDTCFTAKRAGAFLIGGGVPKNYIFQSMLMTPNGFDYAVQLTGDRPDLGGLSGATLDEAKSWGKVTGEARAQTVYGDATITLPLIIAAVRERIEHA
jgi:deoxyhypusine synthase